MKVLGWVFLAIWMILGRNALRCELYGNSYVRGCPLCWTCRLFAAAMLAIAIWS
jgi:hypothetical protein